MDVHDYVEHLSMATSSDLMSCETVSATRQDAKLFMILT